MHTAPICRWGVMVADTAETVGGMYAIQHEETGKDGRKRGSGMCIGYAYSADDASLWASSPELLESLGVLATFVERHKAALIGNECTAEDYERVMKPATAAMVKAKAKGGAA